MSGQRTSAVCAAALLASLCGCAPPTVWTKAGATHQDYVTDSYQCEKDARQSGYFGTGLTGSLNTIAFSRRCMAANGWRMQEAGQAPLSSSSITFTREKWDASRRSCRESAEIQVKSLGDKYFSTAFDNCMKAQGL